jgi:mRNA-degrading endonuclease RelE of RelBE toxin-antitoxin system
MQVIVEERVRQGIRYLQPQDAAKVQRTLDSLQQLGVEDLKSHRGTYKLKGLRDLFILRASPRLRILFRYQDDPLDASGEPTAHTRRHRFPCCA